MTQQKLVLVGAAGEMAAAAVKGLAEAKTDLALFLTDIDMGRLDALAKDLPNPERVAVAAEQTAIMSVDMVAAAPPV